VPIIGRIVVPTFISCIHCIISRTKNRRHGSKNVVLIMPSGWMASGGVGVHAKLDVLSAPPATAAQADVQVEHRLNLARQIGKNGYEN